MIFQNHIRLFLFFIAIIVAYEPVCAQFAFTENKGQWPKDVLLRAQIGGHSFFLMPDGYVVNMQHTGDLEKLAAYQHGHLHDSTGAAFMMQLKVPPSVRSHAYRVRLQGCNKNPRVIHEKPLTAYENFFFGNDPSSWASNCRSYQSVTYKDIYPQIDLRYYLNGEHLKYDFIVNPGGDVKKIRLHYEGTDKLSVQQKEMTVFTCHFFPRSRSELIG